MDTYNILQVREATPKSDVIPLQPAGLLAFEPTRDHQGIAFTIYDYLELADWSGRAIHPHKRGFIDGNLPKLITQLGISEDDWIETLKNFRRHYANFAGSKESLKQCANDHHQCWYKGAG